jgi:hypothetical protein
VIAFNVGVEIGQLIAVAGVVAVAALAARALPRARGPVSRWAAFAALVGVGLVAAPLLTYQAVTAVNDDTSLVALARDSGCSITPTTDSFPAVDGGHTAKVFYEPGEQLPMADFGHSLSDGYVILLYPPDLPADEVDALRMYVTSPEFRGVLAGPDPEPTGQVRALTVEQTHDMGDRPDWCAGTVQHLLAGLRRWNGMSPARSTDKDA